LTDDEFYALTPRQYALLLERHRERERHTEYLVGLVAATIANWSIGAPKDPLKPRDFPLLLLRDEESLVRPAQINRKKIAEQIRAEFARAAKRQPKGPVTKTEDLLPGARFE